MDGPCAQYTRVTIVCSSAEARELDLVKAMRLRDWFSAVQDLLDLAAYRKIEGVRVVREGRSGFSLMSIAKTAVWTNAAVVDLMMGRCIRGDEGAARL